MKWFFLGFLSIQATLNRPLLAENTSSEIDRVVADTCDKSIVILGEDASHGAARSLEVKSEILKRLVNKCHFKRIYFESGFYDFINIKNRRDGGEPIGSQDIGRAIGALWNNSELQPLIKFIAEKLNSNEVEIRGIDDQIGYGSYAQNQMAKELLGRLNGLRRDTCEKTLNDHLLWRYRDDEEFTSKDATTIIDCLKDINLKGQEDEKWAKKYSRISNVLKRFYESERTRLTQKDADSPAANKRLFADREERMLSLFLEQNKDISENKVIIWTATIHGSRGGATQIKSNSFGSNISKSYGDKSFVLGFSAYDGNYGMGNSANTIRLERAPKNTLESRVFAKKSLDVRYVDKKQLSEFGSISGRIFSSQFETLKWLDFVDGVYLFRTERAPNWKIE